MTQTIEDPITVRDLAIIALAPKQGRKLAANRKEAVMNVRRGLFRLWLVFTVL
jgi:hypothetical protein